MTDIKQVYHGAIQRYNVAVGIDLGLFDTDDIPSPGEVLDAVGLGDLNPASIAGWTWEQLAKAPESALSGSAWIVKQATKVPGVTFDGAKWVVENLGEEAAKRGYKWLDEHRGVVGKVVRFAADKAANSLMPGSGPFVEAAFQVAYSMADGERIDHAFIDGARAGAIEASPELGGGDAAHAFDMGIAVAKGKNIGDAAVEVARMSLPPELAPTFEFGVAVARGESIQRSAVQAIASSMPGGPYGSTAIAFRKLVDEGVPIAVAALRTGGASAQAAAVKALTPPTAGDIALARARSDVATKLARDYIAKYIPGGKNSPSSKTFESAIAAGIPVMEAARISVGPKLQAVVYRALHPAGFMGMKSAAAAVTSTSKPMKQLNVPAFNQAMATVHQAMNQDAAAKAAVQLAHSLAQAGHPAAVEQMRHYMAALEMFKGKPTIWDKIDKQYGILRAPTVSSGLPHGAIVTGGEFLTEVRPLTLEEQVGILRSDY